MEIGIALLALIAVVLFYLLRKLKSGNQENNRRGLYIAGIFTCIALLLTATFVVPMIAVMPGILFEEIASKFIVGDPYSNVGKMTIALLSLSLAAFLILMTYWMKCTISISGDLSSRQIVIALLLFFFIVHPLGYYIYWGVGLNFRSDGQLIFAAVGTYPFTCLAFVPIGLLIDLLRKKYKPISL